MCWQFEVKMPAIENGEERTKEPREAADPPIVLSEGAGRALSTVVGRLLKSDGNLEFGSDSRAKKSEKRPRAVANEILAGNEQVQKSQQDEKEEKRRDREAKRARLQFENNAKVIPDAATDAQLEKELLKTATKGAVALFNAVAKAQKVAKEDSHAKSKNAKGVPVSRQSFMSMIREGIKKDDLAQENDDGETTKKASWLKDDFLTEGSRKLKDWDRPRTAGQDSKTAGSGTERSSESEGESSRTSKSSDSDAEESSAQESDSESGSDADDDSASKSSDTGNSDSDNDKSDSESEG